jgi:hypothetical protein
MKLQEIHQWSADNEPLVLIMLRKLMAKDNHVSLAVIGKNGETMHEGWINHIEYAEDSGDYDIFYNNHVDGGVRSYFLTAGELDAFDLVKDEDEENVWHLRGKWSMPVDESIEDEEPLTVTLMRQLLAKQQPLFAQRTKGSQTSGHQALYPVKSLRWDNERRELALTISELYTISGPDKGQKSQASRPVTMHIIDKNSPIDERWTLSKTKHGTVLHVAKTPVTDLRDGDEAK